MAFFLTRSRRIGLYAVTHVADTKMPQLRDALAGVVNFYNSRGFRVRNCFADGAFECLEDRVPGVNIDTCGNAEHVGDIERAVRTIKERIRAIRAGLPFSRLPRKVIVQMVRFAALWLNAFPCRNGISRIFSPRTIVTGLTMSYRLHCRLPFGAHAEVHDNPSPSNLTDVARTAPAICCGPTGNHRGTYVFYSLRTGELVKRHQWVPMVITPGIVRRVHDLADATDQVDGLDFGDRDYGQHIGARVCA